MKKIMFIILLCSVSLNAQNIAMSRGWMPDKEKSVELYGAFDIANAFIGGHILHDGTRRNDKAFDIRAGGSFSYGNDQVGVFLEHFHAVDYYAAGVNYDRIIPVVNDFIGDLDLELLLGVEGMWVHRDLEPRQIPNNYTLKEYFNWGLNLKIQVMEVFDDRLSFGIQNSLVWRSDIKDIWGRDAMPSGTLPAMWEHRSVRFYIQFKIYSDRF